MQQAQLLASRVIKALDESIEASTTQLLAGVETFDQYKYVQAAAQTASALKDRIESELRKIQQSVNGDLEDE